MSSLQIVSTNSVGNIDYLPPTMVEYHREQAEKEGIVTYGTNNKYHASERVSFVYDDSFFKQSEEKRKKYLKHKKFVAEEPWIDDFLKNVTEIKDAKALVPYYMNIQILMKDKKYSIYDFLLNNVETEELHEVLLIGLLRISNPWKKSILSWKDFLEKAANVLEERGHSSKKLLRGLL